MSLFRTLLPGKDNKTLFPGKDKIALQGAGNGLRERAELHCFQWFPGFRCVCRQER